MSRTIARRCAVVSVAALLLIAVGARSAAAQVLDQVPAESLAVLKVKNLQAVSTKISKLATDLNVAAFAPALGDPLKSLQDQAHITQGLNTGGDLFVVFLDPGTSGETPDKSMVVLIPVSDYKAFLGNYPDAQTDGDVSQIQMPNSPQPGFVANWGSFAALSPSKAIVAKKPTTSLKVTAAGDKELGGKDIVVYGNLVAVRGIVRPQLASHRDEILAQADDNLKKNPKTEKMAPVAHAAISQALNIADAFLRDADAATFGINIGDEGLSTTLMADFQPNSYGGKTLASMKNTSDPLLGGIPAGKYLVFGGNISDPAVASKLFADLVDPVAAEITAAGPDLQPINDYVTAMKSYIAANKGTAVGVVAPTGALGQEALMQLISVQKGDADAMSAAMQKALATQPELMKALGIPADTVKTAFTPNAKTVDGVAFSSFTTTFTADPQNPAMAQQQQMMAMMYGPNGMTQLSGIVGGNLLTTSGLNDATLSSAIASAKSGEAPLANLDPVKKVASSLPTSRVMELYIPVDQIVSTGLNYAKQFGFAMPIQLPPDLPPIGEVLSTENSTIRLDSYIPTPLVQSLVAAGMQAAMQMNGGGGGGGGGAPAGPGGGL